MHIAARMSRLGTETAFEVLARAKALERAGRSIIHLEVGEPDFDTPPHIIQAGIDAMRAGHTRYCPTRGILDFRRAIAEMISQTRGLDVSPDHIVVTPGAKPIIFFSIMACIEEGDEVIYPDPGFPIYESMINFVGGKAIPVPLIEDQGFRLDVGVLAGLVTARTRMIILNSPQNPTGGVLPKEDLEGIAEIARSRDLLVMSDEIYSRILYDGAFTSIASLPGMQERTILIDGHSKTYAMTGWRLGYGVMPIRLADLVDGLMVNSNSCTCAFTQHAGLAALTGPQASVGRMVEEFRRRRDVLVDGLNRIPGIRCRVPQGAFYVFPNIAGVGVDCRAFADRLLNDAGVAALPGTAFGQYGDGYLRLSYANSLENLNAALERIEKTVKSYE